ncbi:MAG: VanW family protein [Patescibacteria group bacterium]
MIANQAQKAIYLFKISFFVILFTVGISFLIINQVKSQEKLLENRIYPNVIIDDENVGSLTKSEALQKLTPKYKGLEKVNMSIRFDNENIATMSAQKLDLKHDIKEIIDRAYLIGRVPHFMSKLRQRVSTIFRLSKYNFQTSIHYNKAEIKDFLALAEEKYNKPAKNALFNFENGRVIQFRPEEDGIKIDSNKFLIDVNKEISDLKQKRQNKLIVLEKEIIKPEITLANSNKYGIEELIGVGTSDYSHSIPERIHNILVATSKFNGVLIPPGDNFSFNDIIGDISSHTGYKQAYIIKAGRTVLGDGGGVCQVSTTVFRAALNSGLPIIERTAHAYRVSYYEQDSQPGFDATVYGPTVDFKFKNDTKNHILIQTEVDKVNNILTFKFYGKSDGRKVELSKAKVYDVQPPLPEIREDDPTLRRGAVKQVDFPAWGAKSIFNYKVTRGDEVIFEKEFFSNFRPWQAVYLVGTGEF